VNYTVLILLAKVQFARILLTCNWLS